MAAAGSSPLECSICAELYDDSDHQPKLLTCHHTLCLSCIVRLVKGNIVQCPNKCKQVTTLPTLFPEERNNVTTEKDYIIKGAKKLQYSFYIDMLKENERFQQLVLTQNQIKLCSDHNKTQDVWCKTCQQIICVKCQFTSHNGHDHALLETIEETFQDKINGNLRQIKTQTQKLRLDNASKTKQQYMGDIDREFEQIHNDLVKMLDTKKQAIKTQATLAVDEYMNIQLASLDSLSSIYQHAINSDDKLTKVCVSNSNELDRRLNQLLNQSLSTDDQTVAQIQQYSSNIKQEIHRALESVETPTLSHQLGNTDPKTSSSMTAAVAPTLSYKGRSNNTRVPTEPVKIGCQGSGLGEFRGPEYIAEDSNGMVYVSDCGNNRIQKLNSEGGYVTHWRTEGFQPGELVVNHQYNELICAKEHNDLYTNEVVIYSLDGQVKKQFIITDVTHIAGLAVNSRGQMVCSDWDKGNICVVSRGGDVLYRYGYAGSGPGQLNKPRGVCMGPDDDIVVVDQDNHRIQILDHTGQFKHQFGTHGYQNVQFRVPLCVAIDQYHQVLVSDCFRGDVQVFSYIGEFIRCIDSKNEHMSFPHGLAVTQDHHVLVADKNSHSIFKFKYM